MPSPLILSATHSTVPVISGIYCIPGLTLHYFGDPILLSVPSSSHPTSYTPYLPPFFIFISTILPFLLLIPPTFLLGSSIETLQLLVADKKISDSEDKALRILCNKLNINFS